MTEDLRALAEAATPGPWTDEVPGMIHQSSTPGYIGTAEHPEDRAFIAAANPTAVLALLDRVEAAEAAVERVRALADSWPVGDNGQDYRLAVTQCATAITAALEGPR